MAFVDEILDHKPAKGDAFILGVESTYLAHHINPVIWLSLLIVARPQSKCLSWRGIRNAEGVHVPCATQPSPDHCAAGHNFDAGIRMVFPRLQPRIEALMRNLKP